MLTTERLDAPVTMTSSYSRGSALILTVLVSAVLTTLGLVYLAVADTEQLIASSDRNSEQLLHTAETGLRMVKAWFDQPVTGSPAVSSQIMHRFLGLYDLRNPAFYDRTRRRFDHDGDPSTPPVLADGTAARPYYRQGRTLWAPSSYLDLFHKPYRGDAATTFMGTAQEPDLLLEDRPNVIDFIDVLNNAVFTHQEHTGRISRIAIYAPPRVSFAGAVKPAGIATVEVVVAKYRRLSKVGTVPVVMGERLKLAELRVQMVLAEVPAAAANGALESCGTLDASGGLEARWGKVLARGGVALPSDLDGGIRSAFPFESIDRRISGDLPGDDFYEWVNAPDDVVEDPWLKIVAGAEIAGLGAFGRQPFPHDPNAAIDVDHSNLFQRIDAAECGAMRYETLKAASASGEEHARYFAWDPATGLFKEDGVGAARSVRDWTHDEEGLFFFDTRDERPPNGHGPGDPLTNLTPPVLIESTDWAFSGLLYLNAESIVIRNVNGASRVVVPPGEPFDDADADGLYDAGEAFANLYYPTTLVQGNPGSEITKSTGATQTGTATSPDLESYAYTTTVGRDPQGIPILAQINMFGVLFNAGDVVAEGPARHFGSLIAGHAVVRGALGAPVPEIFFDERLNTGIWPPAEVSFPRTFITLWSGAI